jgi:arylamine N-acetyltransferase
MVDVGFGGDGATLPLPLEANSPVRNLGAQEIRLLHEPIPQQSDRSRPMWIYQYRNGPELDWNSFYCFGEDEFIQQDFEIMNFYTSTSTWERNFQTKSVLTIRFMRGVEDGIERIVGKRMLVDGVVKENLGGKTRVVKICETEEERVEVLREFFGILLNEEEIGGVKGRNVELKGKLPN